MKKVTQEDWIKICKEVHNNKYDYSLVKYTNARDKVDVICHEKDEWGNEHGVFSIRACNHSSGTGCPKCGKRYQMSKEEFVRKARQEHGDKYDYSKVDYRKSTDKVCIICPEHGEFWQIASLHIYGSGCPECAKKLSANKRKLTTEKFIEKAKKIHCNKYDYSKTDYINNSTKVCIICPEHGVFWQIAGNHLNGEGCPECKRVILSKNQLMSKTAFIKKARKVHGNLYDYSKVDYIGYQKPVEIICGKHGGFKQTPDNHLHGSGCPKCGAMLSKNEREIIEYIKSYNIRVIEHDKEQLNGLELDLYLPDYKIAIEYNGIYWHNEYKGKDSNYHLNKLNLCNSLGIKLIQIFEDEYINHKNIVLTKISHIIGIRNGGIKVGARECYIKPIGKHEAKEFLDENHIQGGSNSTLYYGAFMKGGDNLVGVMSFRLNDPDNMLWELTRFATDNKYIVSGLGSKMFSYFKKNNIWKEVKSFADRRWTVDIDNNLYTKIGFKLDEIEKPDYRYVVGNERKHKFLFRKKMLNKKYGLPLTMTEKEMCNQLGFYRIWDCGLIKYVYKNPNYKEER